jgi:MFS family permease
MTGLAGGFASLIALRILLGLGESTAAPSGAKLIVDNLPPARFGIVSGIIGAGIAFGPSFGTLTGGLLMARFGWRAMFLVFGVAALLWLVPWLRLARVVTPAAHEVELVPPRFIEILSQRSLWGGTFGHITANYAFYFLLAWLPLYLVRERGFSLTEMAMIGAMVYGIYGLSAIGWGWIADRTIAQGRSLNAVRKTVIGTGHFGLAACLLGTAVSTATGAVAFLMIAGLFCGMIASTLAAITQTLAGTRAAARWTGLQNMLANIAGIAGPIITGIVVDKTGSFYVAFVLASVIAIVGAAGWLVIIRRVEPVAWQA